MNFATSRCPLAVTAAAVLAAAGGGLAPAPAGAVLVYERPARQEIVAARDDGTQPRVIARGDAPLVSPHGRRVAFTRRISRLSTDLRLVAIRGGRSRLLVRDAYRPLAWSPDGRRVAAERLRRPQLAVAHVHGRRVVGVPIDFQVLGAAFSPRSTRLAFGNSLLDNSVIDVADRAGSVLESLGAGRHPVWGSGGLAFVRSDGNRYEPPTRYDLMLASGPAAPRVVLSTPVFFTPVAWAADRRTLLVSAGHGPVAAALVDTATGRARIVRDDLNSVHGLSRDGRMILATHAGGLPRDGSRGKRILAVPVDGGRARVLARRGSSPSWTR